MTTMYGNTNFSLTQLPLRGHFMITSKIVAMSSQVPTMPTGLRLGPASSTKATVCVCVCVYVCMCECYACIYVCMHLCIMNV